MPAALMALPSCEVGVQQALGHAGEVVHRKVDALGVPAWDVQVAGLFGTAAEDDRVVAVQNLFGAETAPPTSILVRNSTPSACMIFMRRSMTDFVQLHIGDAVHQQAAHAGQPAQTR